MSLLDEIERDFEMFNDDALLRMPKRFNPRFDAFELSDEEFYCRYRFDKATVQFLIDILEIEEPRTNRGLPVAKSTQILCTLRFLGRNVHQSDIGDLHGLSQATVGRIIKNVCKRIALLLPHFIRFPNLNELNEVKNKFYQVARFPTVIGAIDCTHVRIKCPTKSVGPSMAGHFLNGKGFYSINVQIVCDADFKILDIVARSRGSRHDARIWDNCQLKTKLEQTKSQHNGVLVGDSGYPNSSILLTLRNAVTNKEHRYNRSHIATRTKIECLNGQLKSRFRSIIERLRVDLETAKNVIVAVAVLHNIAKERNGSCLLQHNTTTGAFRKLGRLFSSCLRQTTNSSTIKLVLEQLGGYLPIGAVGPTSISDLISKIYKLGPTPLVDIYYDSSYGRRPQVLLIIGGPAASAQILENNVRWLGPKAPPYKLNRGEYKQFSSLLEVFLPNQLSVDQKYAEKETISTFISELNNICDHKQRIRCVDARYPGSNHDSHVWNMSDAKEYFEKSYREAEQNTWILGDAGYPLQPWLITPFRSPEEGSPESAFNKVHPKA